MNLKGIKVTQIIYEILRVKSNSIGQKTESYGGCKMKDLIKHYFGCVFVEEIKLEFVN